MVEEMHDRDGAPTATLIRFNDVPKLKWLPRRRGGSRLSVGTLHRWANDGGPGGRKLAFLKVGSVRCTTEEWLREFFDELAAADGALAGSEGTADAKPKAAEPLSKRAEKAAAMLRAEGFGKASNGADHE